MTNPDWSRRDLLKTAATGAVAVGIGTKVVDLMDRYIVGVRDSNGATAAASVSDVEPRKIDLTEHTSLTLVAGAYSETRRKSLLAREDVVFVQRDRPLTHHASAGTGTSTDDGDEPAGGQTLPWGIDRVDANVAHDEGETGEGVDVGIIDGGIDDTHPDLEGNLADPGSDGNHKAWVECEGGDCTHPWSDDGGHGTHVAGTVAATDGDDGVLGVAPDATLHALKVCGAGGSCRTSHIAKAIRHAADQGWDVVNLSLGSPQDSPALQAAGQYALEAGVLLVASAGNRGEPGSVGYPAAYDEFLAVSATTIEDEIAGFSSTGPEVELAAPGKGVCSAVIGGYGVNDGTSMAAPHVTGAAAQLMANGYSNIETREQLLDAAEDIGKSGDEQGEGLVDVAAALGYDSDDDGTGDGTSCPG